MFNIKSSSQTGQQDFSISDAEQALNLIPADCDYTTWIKIGTALKTTYSDNGFTLWDRWSATYQGDKQTTSEQRHKKWQSFNNSCDIGTLIFEAKNYGYVMPKPHNYLEKKHIRREYCGDISLDQQDNVIVPMTDLDNNKITQQTIFPQKNKDGVDKLFQKGASTKGAVHYIAEPAPDSPYIYICEGLATGASIYEVIEKTYPVICTMSCFNFCVIPDLRKKYPLARFIVCCDNDDKGNSYNCALKYRDFNTQIIIAQSADPVFNAQHGGDFNDLARYSHQEAEDQLINAQTSVIQNESFEEDFDLRKLCSEKKVHWKQTYNDEKPSGYPNVAVALRLMQEYCGIKIQNNVITKKKTVVFDNGSKIVGKNSTKKILYDKLRTVIKDTKDTIKENIDVYIESQVVNPVLNYIRAKPWDHINRYEQLLKCLRIDTNYTCYNELFVDMLTRWFLSAIAVQFNTEENPFTCQGMLVLQGGQGIGKSTFFKIIGGNFYKSGDLIPDNVDNKRQVLGSWIYETSEIESTFRQTDRNKLKQFLTMDCDEWRIQYEKEAESYRRTTIFGATCNSKTFLDDPTGNRRYWVLPIDHIDIDVLKVMDIQQLWAQVYETYLNNGIERIEQNFQDFIAKVNNCNDDIFTSESEVKIIVNSLDWSSFSQDCNRYVYITQLLKEHDIPHPTKRQLNECASEIAKRNLHLKKDRQGKVAIPRK